LHGSGVLSAGKNSDDVAGKKAAGVTGRQDAAGSCGRGSLVTNMGHYNMDVNR
jgi:hypothetical protein